MMMWMKNRPKGNTFVHEIEGDGDIIVVIPTADFNGEFATMCRNIIFKGLKIIFVESAEQPDPYFNYAHSVNVGIDVALRYKPKWIVVSNDDMIKVDDVSKLKLELSGIDNSKFDLVLAEPDFQVSTKLMVCEPTFLLIQYRKLLHSLLIKLDSLNSFSKFASIPRRGTYFRKLLNYYFVHKVESLLPEPSFFIRENSRNYKSIFFRPLIKYTNFEAFGIFSYEYLSNCAQLFDEAYINSHEDHDVSLHCSFKNERIGEINYRIKGIGRSSLGGSLPRSMRILASNCYFNTKMRTIVRDMSHKSD